MNLKSQLLFITFLFGSIFNSSAQTATIPDVNFRNALLSHSPTVDTNNDGLIQVSEALAVQQLFLMNKNISNLTGIAAFSNLKGLSVSYNNLSSIDISQNIQLTGLECYNNNLTTIDVSNNTALMYFRCHRNNLTSIDLSHNTELRELDISWNNLTTLNLSSNPLLTHLNFSENPITTINIKQHTKLISLRCTNTALTALDLSCNSSLIMAFTDPSPALSSICLNSTQYAARTDPADMFGYLWTKSSNTSWTNCPSIPMVTPVPATIAAVDLCESEDMTFNAVSETFITNPTYRWQKATSASGPWTNIPGETNQALVLTNLQMTDNGTIYKVLISSTDYCGSGHMEEAAGQIVLHPAVYPEVMAASSVSGPICDTIQQITFTAAPLAGEGSAPAYQWYTYTNPTFTPISGATNIQYTPAILPASGSQLFVGMFTDAMCAVESGVPSNILTVEILPTPKPVLTTTDIALCNPSGFVIQTDKTAAAGTQFQWFKDGSPISDSNTKNLIIASEGTYYITEDNGVCNIASGTVTISKTLDAPDPVVSITSSIIGPVCDTLQHITYTATPTTTSTVTTYQWYNAATNTAINGATNITYTPAAKPLNGDQVYVMMYTNETCAVHPDVQSNVLTIQLLPTPAPVMLSRDTSVCMPQQYILNVQPSAASGTHLQWYKNGVPVSGANSNTFTLDDADIPGGTYHVSESNTACTIQAAPIEIELMHTPVLYAADDIYAATGDVITLNVQAAHAGHYQWNAAAGLSNTSTLNPTLHVSTSASYILQATNDQERCPVTTQVNVIITPNTIQIPNVITANGDGVNDTWEIENLSHYNNATIEIYNRWGSLVWKSKGYSKQWDGSSYNSSDVLPAGTYFYIIQLNATEKADQSDSYTGYIQLIN